MNKSKSVDAELTNRYDGYDHWIEFDKKPSRSRCKLTGCKNFTHAFCTKCEINLCCSLNRNCFRFFHKAKEQVNKAKQVKPMKSVKSAKAVKQPKQKVPRNRESKQADIAKSNSNLVQSKNHEVGTKTSKIVSQSAPPSILKTSKSSMKPTSKNGCRNLKWKPKLCQIFRYQSESPNEEVAKSIW